MKTSSFSRRILGMVAGIILFVNCFLVSGCNYVVRTSSLFGEDLRQFPAVVLNAQDGSHDYTFDWDKNTIGGIPLSEHMPKAKYWRLHVFRFSDGLRIGNNDNRWRSFESDPRNETFTDLKFDKLMRADLDLADDPKGEENSRTLSFIVLLHDE